jgi:hypothetical protein
MGEDSHGGGREQGGHAVPGAVTVADGEDGLFDGVRAHLEAMIAWGRGDQALGLEHAPLEDRVLADGQEMMRLFTQAHLDLRTAREARRQDVVDADGHARVTVEDGQGHNRVMVYGTVRTNRLAYKRYHKANLYPADRDLNWGQHSYSAGLVKRIAKAVAVLPFAQAGEQLAAAGAVRVGKRQVEELAVGAAVDFEAFYADRRPAARPDDVGLLITADGSAFAVRPEALRPATAKAAAARAAAATNWPEDPTDLRRSKKRSAELVCVADIPPVPRTKADILAALFADKPGPARQGDRRGRPGPVAEGKTLFASAAHPIAQVIGQGLAEAHRRDPDHRRAWYALVDGNNAQITAINTCAAQYGVRVPILIDIIHVRQYLWKAAGSFFYPEDHAAARDWVAEQTGKLLDGKADNVIAGIRRRATRYGYNPKERQGADECATYLENKKDYLDYPAFLAAGRPIASGLIEGACRWMIKDRMEVTGARWSLDSAEAVLKLRALHGNGDFDDYYTYHLQQEKRRNHDSHYHPDTLTA